MKIKKPEGTKEEPPQKTFEEVFEMIEGHLASIENRVSSDRTHAVDTQLRACIRLLGYRVRETAEKRATIQELAAQCKQALKILKGVVPEKSQENLALYALAVLSNLEAEVQQRGAEIPSVPTVPEVPAESTETSNPEKQSDKK
ncbi:MAG TPA: hypothetical protein VMD27_06375 [Candidatus Aquilonibacter sp.]|nr:hypothetical protein [Candidatus Aquilonibacter sp.]